MKKIIKDFFRFIKDVEYDLCVPPYGYDFTKMTPKQAEEHFNWFLSVLPERMEYLRNRCSKDLKLSVQALDYSPESLLILWKWFLGTVRIEKTPKEELKKMKEGAKVFGESFINYEQFTVASQFIMKDIGMYVGQSYILNYPQLNWDFFTKPKNKFNVKEPIISGFHYKDDRFEGDVYVNPMNFVEGAAANIFYKTQKASDLFDYYSEWAQWIPER